MLQYGKSLIMRQVCIALGLIAVLALPVVAVAADLQSPATPDQKRFDIPAGPLEGALNRFGREAGILLSFPSAITVGLRSNGLSGNFAVQDGLARLLEGTGLTYRYTAANSITLEPVPQAGVLPAVMVSADAESMAASPAGPYASSVSTSLGGELPMQQTPATVNVVTDEFWEATGARTLDGVLPYVPGVNLTDHGGWTGDAVSIRGFSANLPYRDGMRAINSYEQSHRIMPEVIERIEVVKGPAGTEFGVVSPGGAINVVTKKPRREAKASVNVAAGENGYRRLSTDVTGAMVDSTDVQGRVIVAYEEPPEWRDGRPDDTHRYVVAPSVNWDYSSDGKLLLAYERNFQNSPQDRGIIYLEGAWPGGFAPREWSYHQEISQQINETDRLTLTNEHRLSDRLTWRTTLEYQELHYKLSEFRNAETEPDWGPLYEADGLTWSGISTTALLWSNWEGYGDATSYMTVLDYVIPAGSATHTLSAGLRGYRNVTDNQYVYYSNTNTIDIFDTDNNQVPDITSMDGVYVDTITKKEEGITGRWLAEWTERFRTILSVQSLKYDYEYKGAFDGEPDPSTVYGSDKPSYRIATSFDVTKRHTLFAGISDGYVPQGGRINGGGEVLPIHDKGIEVGIKSNFLDGRLEWSNSLYRTRRDDIAVADAAFPGQDYLINAGSAEISGFETELTGRVTDNLLVRGGLALMRSELLENEKPEFEGNEFSNTPEEQVSVLVTYGWGNVGLDRLSTTLGVSRMGERYGNSGNTIVLPAYTLVDASASWRLAPTTRVTLAATNALDETYHTGMQDSNSAGADQVMIGEVRNVALSLGHDF